jgi:uncharacterized protein (DUF302 family)
MKYYFEKNTDYAFEEAVEKVTEELKKEGFGVLTEIDVQATLKKKLDVDFRKYRILGACNPPFAHKALQAENKIGAMLPRVRKTVMNNRRMKGRLLEVNSDLLFYNLSFTWENL